MRWALLSNAKPKGVAPLDAYDVTPLAMPFASTVNVSMRLVAFSVTTRTCPVGSNETCAGTAPALSACVDPAMGVGTPPEVSQKPEIEPPDPPLTTYRRLSWTAMLIGVVPPEATLVTHVRPEALTWNEESWLLPAFTARRTLPSSASTTAPWLPSPAPVPAPPVEKLPARAKPPFAARVYHRIAFAVASFVVV